MKQNFILFFLVIALIGCIQSPTQSISTNTNSVVDSNIPVEVDKNVEGMLPTEVNVDKNDEHTFVIHYYSSGLALEKNKDINDFSADCQNGICILEYENNKDYNGIIDFKIESAEILNPHNYYVKKGDLIILYISPLPTFKKCIFTILDQQLEYYNAVKPSFDFICNNLEKFEMITDSNLSKSYFILWKDYSRNNFVSTVGEYQPHSNTIFLNNNNIGSLTEILSHELVHSMFEDSYFPTWFSEGTAVYFANQFTKSNRKKSWPNIITKDEFIGSEVRHFNPIIVDWNHNSDTDISIAYETAYQLVKELSDKYGLDVLNSIAHDQRLKGSILSTKSNKERNSILMQVIREKTGNSQLFSVQTLAEEAQEHQK